MNIIYRNEFPPIPEEFEVFPDNNYGFMIARKIIGIGLECLTWIAVDEKDNSFSKANIIKGKRNFSFYDNTEDEVLQKQIESVRKYHGFYVSCKKARKGSDGKAHSLIIGESPWTNLSFLEAKANASEAIVGNGFSSHLAFGIELEVVRKHINRTVRKMPENLDGPYNAIYELCGKEWCQKYFPMGNFEAPSIRETFIEDRKLNFRDNILYSESGKFSDEEEFKSFMLNTAIEDAGFRIVLTID